MSNIILFDDSRRSQLLPLTYTRPAADLRVGILTIKEKWEKHLNTTTSFATVDYLQRKFPTVFATDNLFINGRISPNAELITAIQHLDWSETLYQGDTLIATRLRRDRAEAFAYNLDNITGRNKKTYHADALIIDHPWNIFEYNGIALEADFELLTKGRKSQPLSPTNRVLHPENVFLEEGAKVEFAILNAAKGPIYIGKDAEIMEGAIVRGGLGMCEKSVLKMGAKIYGPTTLGTYCKVGGEVGNTVFQAHSSKGHEGYLGNSVIGEWCNLGADTNSSNLKNNYTPVKVWNYDTERFANTGLQFCGLIMGDHSKCGINTMFNTGSLVGVSANIFGAGFPRTFIPSFSWGGKKGFITYRLNKVFEVAQTVMARRNKELTQEDKDILTYVFDLSSKYRKK